MISEITVKTTIYKTVVFENEDLLNNEYIHADISSIMQLYPKDVEICEVNPLDVKGVERILRSILYKRFGDCDVYLMDSVGYEIDAGSFCDVMPTKTVAKIINAFINGKEASINLELFRWKNSCDKRRR